MKQGPILSNSVKIILDSLLEGRNPLNGRKRSEDSTEMRHLDFWGLSTHDFGTDELEKIKTKQ